MNRYEIIIRVVSAADGKAVSVADLASEVARLSGLPDHEAKPKRLPAATTGPRWSWDESRRVLCHRV